ncbi:MAG: glycosyltransferase [Paracoccaceae bacterium]
MKASHLRVVIDRPEKGAQARFIPSAVLETPAEAEETRLFGPLGNKGHLPQVDPARLNPDPRLLDEFTPARALAEGVLPIRLLGQTLMVAVTDPAIVPRLPQLTGHKGLFLPHQAPFSLIEEKVLALRGATLAHAAETTVPDVESCREWSALRHAPLIALIAATIIMLVAVAPRATLIALVGWGLFWMLTSTALKLAVLLSAWRDRNPALPPPPHLAHLPVVTIIVALYREADIAHRLITRLGQLDYPQDRLDVILAVEDDDRLTSAALATTELPPWMRVITVPQGALRTKPRALNHALTFARGTIIGIYDAEDAPAPAQIRDVVQRFAASPPEVACLQGILDFYNPRTNWLSRCFTVEYAAWFRVMLPGLARLGLVIPLGGTTLFFRSTALEKLGAWDAWNVTEDADLGLRLARHGFRTELVATVTGEEANCRLLPWVRQRSRWIKGYMLTWAVHMRDPALLLRQLGLRRFLGVQVLFLGSISQALLVPVMWSLWAFSFGIDHPAMAIVRPEFMLPVFIALLVMEGISIAVNLYGMVLRGQGAKLGWVLSSYFYFPLAAFAAYKALYEVIARPFYWDKTSHGHFDLT